MTVFALSWGLEGAGGRAGCRQGAGWVRAGCGQGGMLDQRGKSSWKMGKQELEAAKSCRQGGERGTLLLVSGRGVSRGDAAVLVPRIRCEPQAPRASAPGCSPQQLRGLACAEGRWQVVPVGAVLPKQLPRLWTRLLPGSSISVHCAPPPRRPAWISGGGLFLQ